MDVSIVIPLYNEEESLKELCAWILKVFDSYNFQGEVILVDDGSRDNSWAEISSLAASDKRVKALRFNRNYGKSAALNEGFKRAAGDVVITMDADLQDSPDEIPPLVEMVAKQGFDLVSGWKRKRYDPFTKTLPTKLFNWATRKMSGIHLHDFNCGLKAYRNEVIKSIEVQGEMHRYIPVLAKREGYSRIGEKEVRHSPRKYGVTKFGMERFVNGFLDLLTIAFISRFGRKPMHLFGTLGIFMFVIGALAFAWIGGSKLYYLSVGIEAKNIADQSVFYIALSTMIIGTQLFLAGFLGELIARTDPKRQAYKIREELDNSDKQPK
jgi:glycosyltransferase involved in cell wall biosynthesis